MGVSIGTFFEAIAEKTVFSPPLYPTHPKPYFVRPVTHSLSVHFVLPVVLPHQNSRTETKIFTLASPLPHHTTSCLSRQPKSVPYSRPKPAYKGFYRISNKKGRIQTIQPSDVNFRQASLLPYTLKIKPYVNLLKRFVLCGPMRPSHITL